MCIQPNCQNLAKMKSQAIPRALLWLTLAAFGIIQGQETESTDFFEPTILETTATSLEHTTLFAALSAADLEQILDSDGPFTVFAPSDQAFENWSLEETSALLKPENKDRLNSLISYHIVAGELTAAKILKALCRGEGRASFTTIQGEEIIATIDGIDILLSDEYGNIATIISADSSQCNGVIHYIDRVIVPKKM